jgi:hypothetical protein
MRALRLLILVPLLLAAPAAAQEVAGTVQLRTSRDLGAWDLSADQQLQSVLVTPGGGGAFGGIDYIAPELDDDCDEPDDDDDDDEPDDDDDDECRVVPGTGSGMGSGVGSGAAEPTAYLTDWAARTRVGLSRRLGAAVRLRGDLSYTIKDNGPVLGSRLTVSNSRDLSRRLALESHVAVETQRRGGDAESRLRLGTALERGGRRLSSAIGAELFVDPGSAEAERLRVEVGSALRVSRSGRVGAEVRLQRRLDRADAWEAGLRLGYRVTL